MSKIEITLHSKVMFMHLFQYVSLSECVFLDFCLQSMNHFHFLLKYIRWTLFNVRVVLFLDIHSSVGSINFDVFLC